MDSPSYLFKGRTYKTVAGFSKAIFLDCKCDAHSMVVDRIITATVDRKPNERIVARYHVSEPTPGEPMRVTRMEAHVLQTPKGPSEWNCPGCSTGDEK